MKTELIVTREMRRKAYESQANMEIAFPYLNRYRKTHETQQLFVVQHMLLKDNRQFYHWMFGSPVFHYVSEFDFHCWPIKMVHPGRPEKHYIILTAKGKGTCYEAFTPDEDDDHFFAALIDLHLKRTNVKELRKIPGFTLTFGRKL